MRNENGRAHGEVCTRGARRTSYLLQGLQRLQYACLSASAKAGVFELAILRAIVPAGRRTQHACLSAMAQAGECELVIPRAMVQAGAHELMMNSACARRVASRTPFTVVVRLCPHRARDNVSVLDCAPSQTDAPLSRTLATPEDDVLEDVRTPEHLPVGWRSYVDPRSGCNYYWHMDVARPQWTRPQMDATLLPGWHRATDHVRGCDYFWQDTTGVTQWECPQVESQDTAPSLDSQVMPLELPGIAGFRVLEF